MFNNKADWPDDGSQPFYWSMGDRTGYGLHGDYLFGWKGDALQKAMDGRCAMDSCPQLTRQSDESAIKCTKSQTVKESIGDECKLSRIPLEDHQIILITFPQGFLTFPAKPPRPTNEDIPMLGSLEWNAGRCWS